MRNTSPDPAQELLPGTLDLLILKTLSVGALHGYAIVRELERASESVLKVEEGSLYPALHRMERRGWIDAEWGLSEANRKAKYYRLTARGRAALRVEEAAWTRFAAAVGRVLGGAAGASGAA